MIVSIVNVFALIALGVYVVGWIIVRPVLAGVRTARELRTPEGRKRLHCDPLDPESVDIHIKGAMAEAVLYGVAWPISGLIGYAYSFIRAQADVIETPPAEGCCRGDLGPKIGLDGQEINRKKRVDDT